MQTKQEFLMIGSVLFSLLLITVVFTPYLSAGDEEKTGEMNLLQAAKDGDTETVKALLESGANVNATDENGNTVLMAAAAGGHAEIVQMLLRAGADVNASDKSGYTALMRAKLRDHNEVVEIFTETGLIMPAGQERHDSEALIDALDLNRIMVNAILLSSPQQAHSIVTYVLGKETGLWEATRKDVAIIYDDMFTEHELKQLTAFFKSDAGKKWIDSQEEFVRSESDFFKSGVGKKWIDFQEEFVRSKSYRRQIAVLGCVTAILVPNIEGAKKKAGITQEGIPPEIRSHPAIELLIQDVRTTCVCVIDEAARKWGFEGFISKQNSPEFGVLANHLLTTGKCPIPGIGKVTIKPGMVGIVFQKSGKVDPDGHFIVEKGYQGIQREVLMPGAHQTTSFMKVTQAPMTVIPEGKVGVLIAQDGRTLPEGAILAEDDEIDPETGKLIKMGQKGIRKSLLMPGTYPINTTYLKVEVHDALEVKSGKVGVLIRKIGDPSPAGQILVSRDSPYRGIIKELFEPGMYYLHPYMYAWEVVDAVIIPEGKIGILTRKIGTAPPAGTIMVDRNSEYQGIIREVLKPGSYYFNPYEIEVELASPVSIPDGFVGVIIARTGKPAPVDQLLVEEGFRGVRNDYLKPGLYDINPYEFYIIPIDTRPQTYAMTSAPDQEEHAVSDAITFLSNDGFRISLDATVRYNIQPENAPYVVATLGKNLDDIKTKIIRPGSRSFARLEGSMLKAVDFVSNDTRKNFQYKLATSLHAEGVRAKITIINIVLSNYTLPEEVKKQAP